MKIILLITEFFIISYVFSQNITDTLKTYPIYYLSKCDLQKDNSFTGNDTFYCLVEKENIIIKAIASYKYGNINEIKGYYPNGAKYSCISCLNRNPFGISLSYFDNNNIKFISISDGINQYPYNSTEWFKNGRLKTINNEFKDEEGKIRVIYQEWNIDGFLKYEYISMKDNSKYFLQKSYYDTGQLKSSEIYLNDSVHECKYYNEFGKLIISGFAKKGQVTDLIGLWHEWYENGVLKKEYNYNNTIPNQKEGTWKYLDEKGNLIKEEFYKNGDLIDTKEYIKSKKID